MDRILVKNRMHLMEIIDNSPHDANLNHLDVSQINDMSYMFSISSFNGDISEWDVSNVFDMRRMFYHSSFNGDISKWDVSNVIYKEEIFTNSKISDESKIIFMMKLKNV